VLKFYTFKPLIDKPPQVLLQRIESIRSKDKPWNGWDRKKTIPNFYVVR